MDSRRPTFLHGIFLGCCLLTLGSSPARVGSHSAIAITALQDSNPMVVMETSMGDIHIELYPDRAPKTVENFLQLVQSGFYDEMVFHRVVRDYVIQAGQLGMDGEFRGEDVTPIENEAGNRLKNFRSTIAMARVDDPHSATTEFYINVRDNPNLDYTAPTKREWGYAVFGRVVSGMDVVDEISKIRTQRVGPYQDFPQEPVAIYAAYVLR